MCRCISSYELRLQENSLVVKIPKTLLRPVSPVPASIISFSLRARTFTRAFNASIDRDRHRSFVSLDYAPLVKRLLLNILRPAIVLIENEARTSWRTVFDAFNTDRITRHLERFFLSVSPIDRPLYFFSSSVLVIIHNCTFIALDEIRR